jgi:hypothetical protein
MANFTGQAIRDSYDRLLQIDGGTIQDGLGQSVTGTIAGLTISNNLTVNGNFTVSGTVTGIDFSDIAAPANLISSSAQISALGFTSASSDIAALNTFTSSAITTASSAMNVLTFTKGDSSTFTVTIDTGSLASVQFANIQNKPVLISGSVQIADLGFVTSSVNVISSSTQIIQNLPEDTVSSSAQVHELVGGVIFSSSNQVTFNYTQLPDGTVSSSAQIKAGLPENTISGSVQISDLGFVTSSINIISSSTQIIQNLPQDTVSSSKQIITQVGGVIFSSSNQVTFNYTQLPDGTVSSSAQTIANLPEGTVSSSDQITLSTGSLPAGTVTSSAQISFGDITGKPTNFSGSFNDLSDLPTLFSSSDQVTFNYTQLPDGTVSSSAQIKAGLPASTISSSTQIEDFGFVTSSTTIISSSTQIIQNLPGNTVSSSTQIVNLIENNYGGTLVTSSTQIFNLGFISSSTTIFSSSTQIKDNLPAGTVSSSTQTIANVSGALITPTRIHAGGPITASRFVTTETGTPTLRAANNLVLSASNAVQVQGGVLRLPTFSNSQTGSLTLLDGDMIYNSTTDNIMYYSASNFQPLDRDFSELEGRPTNLVSGGQQIVDLLVNRDLSLRSITASLAQTSSTIFGTDTNNTHDFTGSVRVSGSIETHGHIVPKGFGKYDLGSISAPFRDLYISTASIRIISPPPNEGEDGTIEREVNIDNLVTLTDSNFIVSSSEQITTLGFVTASDNVFSASNQVSFADITGKPSNFTGSYTELSNIPGTIVSSSAQIHTLVGGTIFSSSDQVTFNYTQLPDGTVSSSAQIKAGLPAGTISSSNQIEQEELTLNQGIVSSSVQIEALGFVTSSVSVYSSSTQIVQDLPEGTVSSSAQINLGSATGTAAVATRATLIDAVASNTSTQQPVLFTTDAGQSKTAKVDTAFTFRSDTNVLTVPFIKTNVISGSAQIKANLPSGTISSSAQVDMDQLTLPSGLLSSSTQVGALTNVTVTQDRTYEASLTFDGDRYIRYTDSGDTSRYAIAFDGTNNIVKYLNRAANGKLEFYANNATAGSTGEAKVLTVENDKATFDKPIHANQSAIFKGGNVVLGGSISLELSGSSGQSHIRYRDSLGSNKTFISADHDNDFIKFSNRSANGYFNFYANNATAGASGEQKVAEYRHDRAQFYQNVYADNLVSSSAQIKPLLPSSIFSSSAQLDAISTHRSPAGRFDFNGQVKFHTEDTIFNSHITISGSGVTNVRYWDTTSNAHRNFITLDAVNNEVTFMNRAANGNIKFTANNAAGSAGESDVANFTYNQAQFYQDVKAPNLISQSAQVTLMDTVGNLSGSRIIGDIQASSVEFANVLNKPIIVSSSTQIEELGFVTMSVTIISSSTQIVQNLPGNTVSSSTQIVNLIENNYGGSIITSSTQIFDLGFVSQSTTIISSSEQVNYTSITGVPSGIHSSSAQVVSSLLNQNVDFGTGDITVDRADVSDRIRHDGDDDTSIVFQNNQIWVNAGGRSNIGFGTTETVINEDSHDHNFRVESNGNTNAIFVDGGLNRVGILKGNPQSALDVNGSVRANYFYGDGSNLTNISQDALPDGVVSSSVQVNFTEINNLPGGLISSSTQVIIQSSSVATTASYVDLDAIDFSSLTHYDDDAAAAAGGVPVGKLYRNGNFIQVRLS